MYTAVLEILYVNNFCMKINLGLDTAGEVAVTVDTATELSGTDQEDKREQSVYR